MKKDRLINCIGKDWTEFLLPFFQKQEWLDIQEAILHDKKDGKLVCPSSLDLFRCFRECPWEKMHTLILVNECYNSYYKKYSEKTGHSFADGIALSAKYNNSCPTTLNYILDVVTQIYTDSDYIPEDDNYDLARWANQGILLLDCCPTTIVGGEYSHAEVWKPFIAYVCEIISYYQNNMGVIFIGNYAKQFTSLFENDTFSLFTCDHPKEAIRSGDLWNDNNAFSSLTKFQDSRNGIKIDWQ